MPTSASKNASPSVPPILLPDAESAALLRVSRRKFQELQNEPWMPRPVVLGPRLLRWSRAELEQAIAAMPRQAERGEPAELRRGRIERLKAGATVTEG
jgi:predicted DNA-binding transcriptional regulator AlpA